MNIFINPVLLADIPGYFSNISVNVRLVPGTAGIQRTGPGIHMPEDQKMYRELLLIRIHGVVMVVKECYPAELLAERHVVL